MLYSRHSLQLGQDTVGYIDQGTGPTLVCLHAIGHSADDYAHFIQSVSPRFRCIAIDFPGHGASSKGCRPVSSAFYADVVEAMLNQLAIERCILIGNSIGGATAIELAIRLPEKVQALILCNPGGIFERNRVTRIASPVFAGLFAQGEKHARWYKTFFSTFYRSVLTNAPARARRDEIIEQAYETAQVCREAWQSFGTPESDLRDSIRQLNLPILVAWATQDRINRLKLNLPTIRALKNGNLKTYPAGHVAFLECPDEFLKDFETFVASLCLTTDEPMTAQPSSAIMAP